MNADLAEKSNTVVEEDDPPTDTLHLQHESQEPAGREIEVQEVLEVEPWLVLKVRHIHSNSLVNYKFCTP